MLLLQNSLALCFLSYLLPKEKGPQLKSRAGPSFVRQTWLSSSGHPCPASGGDSSVFPDTATLERCWCQAPCLPLPFAAASSASSCIYSVPHGASAAPQHPHLCPSSLRFCRGQGSVAPHYALLHCFLSELLHSLSGFIIFNLTLALIGINISVPCVTEPLVSSLQGSSLLPTPILLFSSRSMFTGC